MDKCPCCERKFERLEDYPKIKITGFERLELPDRILEANPQIRVYKRSNILAKFFKRDKRFEYRSGLTHLPKEIAELFSKSNKDEVMYDSFVCKKEDDLKFLTFFGEECYERYTLSKDCTELVKKILDSEEARKHLTELENLVGKEMRTTDLDRMLPIGWDFSNQGLGHLVGPTIVVGINPKDELVAWFDGLVREGEYTLFGKHCVPLLNVDLAKFQYEEKINQPPSSSK